MRFSKDVCAAHPAAAPVQRVHGSDCLPHEACVKFPKEVWSSAGSKCTLPKPLCPCVDTDVALQELSFDYQWEAHHLRENTKCLCGSPQCR